MRIRFGKFVNKTLNIKIFLDFTFWTFSECVYLEVCLLGRFPSTSI